MVGLVWGAADVVELHPVVVDVVEQSQTVLTAGAAVRLGSSQSFCRPGKTAPRDSVRPSVFPRLMFVCH